jgi:hypothetical protein
VLAGPVLWCFRALALPCCSLPSVACPGVVCLRVRLVCCLLFCLLALLGCFVGGCVLAPVVCLPCFVLFSGAGWLWGRTGSGAALGVGSPSLVRAIPSSWALCPGGGRPCGTRSSDANARADGGLHGRATASLLLSNGLGGVGDLKCLVHIGTSGAKHSSPCSGSPCTPSPSSKPPPAPSGPGAPS